MGHWSDPQSATGCTVLIFPRGAVGAVDVRGSAPGTRETDVLRPGNLVARIQAVLLTGGSAFGLDAASGVMAWLEERGWGFETPGGPVPLVVGAVLFDLDIGDGRRRPGPGEGRAACEDALREGLAPARQGNVGAGCGATVGKLWGPAYRMKGGLGVAGGQLPGGFAMAAVAAVNCAGNVVDPATGRWVAGAWDRERRAPVSGEPAAGALGARQATTLAAVVTDLPLSSADLQRVASMAHDGIARAVVPAHTLWDGDTIFALSTREPGSDGTRPYGGMDRAYAVSAAGQTAAELVALAILHGVRAAQALFGTPAAGDIGEDR
ncbi:P1 family peptidase [Carboxydochorda subterranea]|uniref:P1 family peptidase n=1 Tax=Carboxydichorda subterranea TaxID=3109565 RepID=A0ABZ1C1C1_9FIRM|nr:P1 family peptidase [Limnochorda sp. L945t]WRP18894.1 P1 family peptidase [Limnochorda sp. L945t]